MGRIVHGASCPWGELSVGRVVRGVKCPGGDCPWGEMSVGRNVRGAKCPWGELSWGELSWGELSWGELSSGEWSGNPREHFSSLNCVESAEFLSLSFALPDAILYSYDPFSNV
jgi:hypothetical protein